MRRASWCSPPCDVRLIPGALVRGHAINVACGQAGGPAESSLEPRVSKHESLSKSVLQPACVLSWFVPPHQMFASSPWYVEGTSRPRLTRQPIGSGGGRCYLPSSARWLCVFIVHQTWVRFRARCELYRACRRIETMVRLPRKGERCPVFLRSCRNGVA